MCKDQLCVKHAKFLTSHMPIFEYQSPKHKARVFRYCINSQNFGKLEGLGGGGEASPLHPPVDETLLITGTTHLTSITMALLYSTKWYCV